jgi:hypothetical protein
MTGAKGDALELIRSLKEQYPDETEDQLISRFHIADMRTDDKNPRLHFQPSPPATRCICGGWFHVIGFS